MQNEWTDTDVWFIASNHVFLKRLQLASQSSSYNIHDVYESNPNPNESVSLRINYKQMFAFVFVLLVYWYVFQKKKKRNPDREKNTFCPCLYLLWSNSVYLLYFIVCMSPLSVFVQTVLPVSFEYVYLRGLVISVKWPGRRRVHEETCTDKPFPCQALHIIMNSIIASPQADQITNISHKT